MTRKADYRWKEGARLSGDAGEVGSFLETLRKKNDGELTAEIVLNAAQSKRSPIHDYFTWDDEEAADKHRLWEARKLIGSVEIVYAGDRDPIRAFVNVKVDDESVSAEHSAL